VVVAPESRSAATAELRTPVDGAGLGAVQPPRLVVSVEGVNHHGQVDQNAFDARREVTTSVRDVGNLPEACLAGYWPLTRLDV
jgi:hypothetical protein